MIKSVSPYQIDDVFKKDASFHYIIPKYQREYTWSTNEWKDLYDDISENDLGYFIGSIICIDNSNDAFKSKPLEVVDGQQRLTTLSLLLLALYNKLKIYKDSGDMDEDDEVEVITLKKSIIAKDAKSGLILTPQIQNNNLNDYLSVMSENGLVKIDPKPKNKGNRKITRCYKYFLQRIENDIENVNNPIEALLAIKTKILRAVLVKIEVSSHAEAYTLFESLNNRGTALTSIDLMKNLILSKAEKAGLSCDDCFDRWQELLKHLTDDYTTQERFFRHYYNAFKATLNIPFKTDDGKKDPLGYLATRSNLLSIFESLINKNLSAFLDDILICGEIYSKLILSHDEQDAHTYSLQELSRIQGAPSYLLLMYLFKNHNELNLSEDALKSTINLLVKFFVRRNITDTPNTRDLTRIFMTIISEIETNKIKGDLIYTCIFNTLSEKSASDEIFKERLKGNIYEENVGVTRFVLCSLAKRSMTNETWTNLWEQHVYSGKKQYKWTIEHIFPEGKNIPECWVNMIADGNRALANDYLENYVHKIGNLTISVYNSTLSNSSFIDKRDRKKDDKYIGYKNGLGINEELALKNTWTINDIQNRTDMLVEVLMDMYSL